MARVQNRLTREEAPLFTATLPEVPLVDSHVHLWDPGALDYPWLEENPPLRRAFLPADFDAATRGVPVGPIVCVEGNPRPDQAVLEVELIERFARAEPRIRAIVAFCDLTRPATLPGSLDRLQTCELVRGIRHNVQGEPPGFCLRPSFVEGVREVGRRGLTFDLCATHDQLPEVVRLVSKCPGTHFVLDHCGKPAARVGSLDPWRTHLRDLAGGGEVCCKLSGLLTEAGPEWTEDDLLPYAFHVAECFGPERTLYGSDWPVLTLAGRYVDWYQFTRRFVERWNPAGARAFFRDNAVAVYGL